MVGALSRSAWPNIPPRTKEDKEEILDITRRKFQKMVKEAEPYMCWYDVTEKCDLGCKLCFAASTNEPLEDELTTTEAHWLLDNIAQAGTRAIAFAGGEPTLREDLPDLIRYAVREKQMFVAINTNGQLLADRKYVAALAQAGMQRVKVSVDGLQQSHDWNRGSGTFEKCIQALENCVEEGIPSRVFISTITQMNLGEVPRMIELALGLGADIFMIPVIPLGRAKAFKHLMLTKEQTREWQRYLFNQQKIYGVSKIQFEDRYQISEDEDALWVAIDPQSIGTFMDTPVGCTASIWQYMISANGKVFVGDVITPETEICDLREQRLSDVWHNSEVADSLRDRDKLKGKCGRCEYRFVCGGCRRQAFAATGDFMETDPQCWYEPSNPSFPNTS